MVIKRHAWKAIVLAFIMAFTFSSIPQVNAESANKCSGFKLTNCGYTPPNSMYPAMFYLTFKHDSNRAVFNVRGKSWTPAVGLGFVLQTKKNTAETDCSGFRIEKCTYIPKNDEFPAMYFFDIRHDSNSAVFRVRDKVWTPVSQLAFVLQ